MAFELYGMLAGNVSPLTGENIKPAYGGEEEAFLRKVVTPIYDVIAKVLSAFDYFLFFFPLCEYTTKPRFIHDINNVSNKIVDCFVK
jgi:hypothetical protein